MFKHVTQKTILLLGLAVAAPGFMCAATWTNWSSASGNTVTGTLGGVGVTYTGEVNFTQLNNTGTNYYSPSTTYVGGPSTSDMIAISGNSAVHTFTFSSAVVNPVLAVVSLGGLVPTSYTFSSPFTIVSQGAGSTFGGCSTCLTVSGNTLTGNEGDGIIQFNGTFTSLSFTAANGEYWNGFTIGTAGATVVPEPASIGLAGIVLAGGALLLRRRKTSL